MLSQTADHALRAILYLAQEPTGFTAPADRIATALGAPLNGLSRTLRPLSHPEMVRGLRGPTGGFRLEIPPAELTRASRQPFQRTSVADLLDGRCAKAAHVASSFSI